MKEVVESAPTMAAIVDILSTVSESTALQHIDISKTSMEVCYLRQNFQMFI